MTKDLLEHPERKEIRETKVVLARLELKGTKGRNKREKVEKKVCI